MLNPSHTLSSGTRINETMTSSANDSTPQKAAALNRMTGTALLGPLSINSDTEGPPSQDNQNKETPQCKRGKDGR